MNHKHHHRGGGFRSTPPLGGAGGNGPPTAPIRNAEATPAMPSPEITQLLAELETVLATAEEIGTGSTARCRPPASARSPPPISPGKCRRRPRQPRPWTPRI